MKREGTSNVFTGPLNRTSGPRFDNYSRDVRYAAGRHRDGDVRRRQSRDVHLRDRRHRRPARRQPEQGDHALPLRRARRRRPVARDIGSRQCDRRGVNGGRSPARRLACPERACRPYDPETRAIECCTAHPRASGRRDRRGARATLTALPRAAHHGRGWCRRFPGEPAPERVLLGARAGWRLPGHLSAERCGPRPISTTDPFRDDDHASRHLTPVPCRCCALSAAATGAAAGPETCLTLRDNAAVAQCANQYVPGRAPVDGHDRPARPVPAMRRYATDDVLQAVPVPSRRAPVAESAESFTFARPASITGSSSTGWRSAASPASSCLGWSAGSGACVARRRSTAPIARRASRRTRTSARPASG